MAQGSATERVSLARIGYNVIGEQVNAVLFNANFRLRVSAIK